MEDGGFGSVWWDSGLKGEEIAPAPLHERAKGHGIRIWFFGERPIAVAVLWGDVFNPEIADFAEFGFEMGEGLGKMLVGFGPVEFGAPRAAQVSVPGCNVFKFFVKVGENFGSHALGGFEDEFVNWVVKLWLSVLVFVCWLG